MRNKYYEANCNLISKLNQMNISEEEYDSMLNKDINIDTNNQLMFFECITPNDAVKLANIIVLSYSCLLHIFIMLSTFFVAYAFNFKYVFYSYMIYFILMIKLNNLNASKLALLKRFYKRVKNEAKNNR